MRTCFVYNVNWTPGLHLGSARVLLLNWIAAKKAGGRCVLIYDDLAQSRLTRAMATVHDLIGWLGEGVDPCLCEEGPYHHVHSQYDYRKAVDTLMAQGWAYRDYATPDEMHKEQQAVKSGELFCYSRQFAAFTKKDCELFESDGRQAVVRLKMPRDTETQTNRLSVPYHDALHPAQQFELSDEHDHVIQRADGSYTSYLTLPVNYDLRRIDFAYVDTRHMQSIPAQLFIAQRLRLKLPEFAHVPFLLGPNGRRRFTHYRMGKYLEDKQFAEICQRAAAIDSELEHITNYGPLSPCYLYFYRRIGCLPEAMRHYLLGSALKESLLRGKEPLSDAAMIAQFKLQDVNSEPESFDVDCLWDIQRAYMRSCSFEKKCWMVNEFLRAVKLSDLWPISYHGQGVPRILGSLVDGLSDQLVVGGDIIRLTDYFDDKLRLRDDIG